MFLSSFIFFASSGFRPVSESKKRSLSSLYKGTEPKTCVAQDPQVSAGRALIGTQFLLQVLQGCMAVSHPDAQRQWPSVGTHHRCSRGGNHLGGPRLDT